MIYQRLSIQLRSKQLSSSSSSSSYRSAKNLLLSSLTKATSSSTSYSFNHCFSTKVENNNDNNNDNDNDNTPFIPQQFLRERPPSILQTTFSNNNNNNNTYTLGQAWTTIQKHIAGGEQIRHSDFISLCQSSRYATYKDAKLLHIILQDLKRCNRFILTKENANEVVNGMYRSLMLKEEKKEKKEDGENGDDGERSDLKNVKGFYKVRCGLMIGESFVNQKTGLYVSLDTDIVQEKVLEPLLSGLMDLQQKIEERRESNDDEQEEKNQRYRNQTNDLIIKSVKLSKDIFDTLLTRASVPTKDMKKRAKRKYLRYLRCSSGPTPSAIDLLVRICLLQIRYETEFGDGTVFVGNDDTEGENKEEQLNGLSVAKSILDAFEEKQYLGKALDSTYTLIQEAEERLEAASTAAATVEEEEANGEEEEAENTDIEKDKN